MNAALGDNEVPVDGNGHDRDGGHEDAQVGKGLHQPTQGTTITTTKFGCFSSSVSGADPTSLHLKRLVLNMYCIRVQIDKQ